MYECTPTISFRDLSGLQGELLKWDCRVNLNKQERYETQRKMNKFINSPRQR